MLEILKRNVYHTPRNIHYRILNEMESFGLIERINNRAGYRILKIKEKIDLGII